MKRQRNASASLTRRLALLALAAAAIVTSLTGSVGTANAAKVTTVAKPTSFVAYTLRPDIALGLLSPSSTYNQSQLLTGPNSAGRPVVLGVGGNVTFEGLQPSSTYTFQARNVKPGSTSSAWVVHTFTTPATYASRPAAPVNLRITGSTATTVTLTWDAPDSGSYSYLPELNGIRVGTHCSTYCTDLERRTSTIAKPAAGSTAVFSVSLRDVNFNRSLPAQLVVSG